MNPYEPYPVEEHRFPIHELAQHMKIDLGHVPTNMQASLIQQAFGHMLCEIRARAIKGKTVHEKVEVPADWWQHLKQRWFPAWALRRWPARMRTIDVRVTRLCPHIKLDERNRSHEHIVFLLGREE